MFATVKNTAIALAFAATATFAADAEMNIPSGTYKLDPTHASVTWKVNHLGLSNYTARFTGIDASIKLNAENQTASSVSVTIDPNTVETDYPAPQTVDFDAELRGEQFFNTAKFATITFKSTGLTLTDEKHGTMTGTLTLLGVSQPVTMDVTLNGTMPSHPYAKKPAMGLSAVAHVKRSDFGMKHLIPYIGDDVTVLIEAEFIKAD